MKRPKWHKQHGISLKTIILKNNIDESHSFYTRTRKIFTTGPCPASTSTSAVFGEIPISGAEHQWNFAFFKLTGDCHASWNIPQDIRRYPNLAITLTAALLIQLCHCRISSAQHWSIANWMQFSILNGSGNSKFGLQASLGFVPQSLDGFRTGF